MGTHVRFSEQDKVPRVMGGPAEATWPGQSRWILRSLPGTNVQDPLVKNQKFQAPVLGVGHL